MNLHRAHIQMLILAVAAVVFLLMSVSLMKAPEPKAATVTVSSQVQQASFQYAAAHAASAGLQTVSTQSTGDWVRADTVEVPVKQTRWVF